MPIYEYKGLTKEGKNLRGTVDADNLRSAKLKLKKNKIFVVEIKDKSKVNAKNRSKQSSFAGKVNIQDLSMMTRQLSTLLKASIPLVDALTAVSEQVDNPTLKNIVADSKNSVNEGGSFHKSIAKYPKIFDKIYVSMCEAGEVSGTLDTILERLAEFTEAQHKLTSKVKSAMIYPVIMFVFISLMLVGLFIFVIPKITEVFDSFPELVLPWYSKLVIDISGFMTDYWAVLLVSVVAIYFMFLSWRRSDSGSKQYDRLILKTPVIGPLIRMVAISRFTRTLSTLLNGGVPMISSMNIVRNVVNNDALAIAIDTARDNISEGESIAGPLKRSGQFPPLVLHMISVGEKTGGLEHMLTQVSDAYDYQVESAVDGLTSLLEPVMLVLMGGVIGLIVISVLVPILELSNIGG